MRSNRGHHVSLPAAALTAILTAACGPSTLGSRDGGGGDDDGGTCPAGMSRCIDGDWMTCNNGAWQLLEDCPKACADGLGCTFCEPNTGVCNGETATMCKPDGSDYIDVFCDPVQGMSCDVDTGLCMGDCAPQLLGQSYIGCEYYPTVTGNEVDGLFTYAVAISNTSGVAANIQIDGGALTAPDIFTVAPSSVQVRVLPWVPNLKACTSSGQLECGVPQVWSSSVPGGAYHLRSDHPVTVYQFNPLDYVSASSTYSYTNDASLLMPVNVMTGNYAVASWPTWASGLGSMPGLIAITATRDSTTVTVSPRGATVAGTGVVALSPGVSQSFGLDAGGVLQLFTAAGSDTTGTMISANQPVQVIGGHYCTQVPIGVTACDHLEESMFPIETLGAEYIITAPAVPSIPTGKVEIIRIIAIEDNTTLTYDPPQSAAGTLATAGSFIEIVGNATSFSITADKKILVAQLMEGQDAGGGTGDPAMALAVPTGQYRTEYLFHAPVNYETNYVNITAPTGASITLDGSTTPLTGFEAIGSTGYGLLRVTLDNSGDGNHRLEGDEPFGISVYGYGQYTSFWYPGGLDLAPIDVN